MTKRLCIWSMLLLSFIVFTAQAQVVDPPKIEIPEKYQQPVIMGVGEEYQIDLQSIFPNDQIQTLAMMSSNSSLFTVSSTGRVKCNGIGTGVISIIPRDNQATKVEIQFTGVAIQPTSISVKSAVTLEVGRMFQILPEILPANATNKMVVYSCNNATVATVSIEGIITGMNPGTCVILIQSASNPSVSSAISVQVIGEGIPISGLNTLPIAANVKMGEECSVTVLPIPSSTTYTEVTYSYTGDIVQINPSTIWNTYTIKGLRPGTAVVTFISTNNPSITGTCTVTVLGLCDNSTAPKTKSDTIFVSPTLNDYKNGTMPVTLEVEAIPNSQYVWEGNWSKTYGTNVLKISTNINDSTNFSYTVYRADQINNCYTKPATIHIVKKACMADPTFVSQRYYSLLPDSEYPTLEVKESDAVWFNADYKPIMYGNKLSFNELNLKANEYQKFFVIRQQEECISTPQYSYITKYKYIITGTISLPLGAIYEPYTIDVNNGEYKISSDKTGKFVFEAPKAGIYTFSLKTQKNIVIDEKRVIELTAQNYNQKIYFYPTLASRNDLAIAAVGRVAVVGRVMNVTAIVYNYGAKVYNVPVSVVYDSLTAAVNMDGQTIDYTKRTIQFTIDSVNAESSIAVIATVIVSTDWHNQGKNLNFIAKIEKSFDTIPANDSSVFSTPILNSYDPNDKAVSPAFGDKGYVLFNQPLEYLIRFQNVGTIDAENIKVVDTLDENLDLSSFEVLAQSHPMTWQMNGREVTFRFDDIHLIDSTTNEKESHGYVKYRIKPKAKLTENTKVTNTAHIFFDYNPAVVTNTTASVYVSKLPIEKHESMNTASLQLGQLSETVYPNPAQKSIQVAVTDIVTLQIAGIDGQLVKTIAAYSGEAIDVSTLAAGIYTITTSGNSGITTHRFTKQ